MSRRELSKRELTKRRPPKRVNGRGGGRGEGRGKRALATGVTGQDGANLARLLLAKGYEVHGIKRRSSSFNTGRIDDIYVDPHERETTPFAPRSPYAAAELHAYWVTVNYREAYGLHASNGILFNHESPVKGETFVTRKITRAVAAIEQGWQECLHLGNLDAKRDRGHARDYVAGMWAMLQQAAPGDYVLATGETHSVRAFVEAAFAHVGREIVWSGKGLEEVGRDRSSGKALVRIDPRYFRPTEVDLPLGDATKERKQLGWRHETTFSQLVAEMMEADTARARLGRAAWRADGEGKRETDFEPEHQWL